MTAVELQKVEVTPDGLRAWCHFSQPNYWEFGRTENLAHWQAVMTLLRAGRAAASKLIPLDLPGKPKQALIMLGVQYTFNPDLWRIRRGRIFPYKVSAEMTQLGHTSGVSRYVMVNKLDNRELASFSIKFICFDLNSRGPAPLPDWIQQKFAHARETAKILDFPRTAPEVPMSAFIYRVTVAPSDTDFITHTSHASYVRFCCDAAQMALTSEALSGFRRDIGLYPLTHLQAVHFGESQYGDNLHVSVWQQPDRQDKIHFVIAKQGKDGQLSVVSYIYMVFQLTKIVLQRSDL